ncbi:unnamed protein product [Darwinula stevensoni]|uniref:Uncharacterized protein n=1 Tax=Darwinula stevensoni TaxID=69355 RepID=A0A7R8XDL8_9CRUS|nr:unnamed protein product [Darwinula stevensoni]CAG0886962.1 unnamed protein product [Darwinula stevensoni]
MSYVPLVSAVLITFVIAALLLYRYGNWFRHHPIVTLSVLVAWYFSFIIIVIIPIDVSSTMYRQCLQEHRSGVHELDIDENMTMISMNSTEECEKPWSLIPERVLPRLWRVVYWTSQSLTWLILPLMQSYTKAGAFTVLGKLKTSLIDNAIYYGSYLLICIILLIYIALRPELELDGPRLKVIAVTASNTWGLFLLVLLLGYGLVEVPRSLWLMSKRGYRLRSLYFKASKLASEKSEAEENMDDVIYVLGELQVQIPDSHPLHVYLMTVLSKLPREEHERMARRRRTGSSSPNTLPSEKALIKVHTELIRALQRKRRTQTQWANLVEEIAWLEEVARNENSLDHVFRIHSDGELGFKPERPWWRSLYTPKIEWYWECAWKCYAFKALAVVFGVWSVFVVWSEVSFFNKEPVLSLFAKFVQLAKENYDYFSMEVISFLTISYLCICAYYTVFKIRILNLYYLAPHHQTDEYSLIFAGMLLCRLTPPLCLNFLGLIHLDSHITKKHGIEETAYTNIMGHMDVISIVSDGFNIYFPMAVLALCLATYYSLGARFLSLLGFQQFMVDDDITTDLVEEGKELVRRGSQTRLELLTNAEPMATDYSSGSRFSGNDPPRNIFDDI